MKEGRPKTTETNEELIQFWDTFICKTFGITSYELKELERRIQATKGLIRVFMHPLSIGSVFTSERIVSGSAESVRAVLDKAIIQNKKNPSSPLNLVLLDESRGNDLTSEYERLKNVGSGTIVSMTERNRGKPNHEFCQHIRNNIEYIVADTSIEEAIRREDYIAYITYFKCLSS